MFVESISNEGIREGLWNRAASRTRFRESGNAMGPAWESWKPGGNKSLFSFVGPGVSKGEWRTYMEQHGHVWRLMEGYEVLVVDIYSCLRR